EPAEGAQVSYELRASLLDARQQQFFGQTWRSSAQSLKNGKICFNQVLNTPPSPLSLCARAVTRSE
ncbi:hypothetical protein NL108_015606, partial [Boleophthalmus pectinirostris]